MNEHTQHLRDRYTAALDRCMMIEDRMTAAKKRGERAAFEVDRSVLAAAVMDLYWAAKALREAGEQ